MSLTRALALCAIFCLIAGAAYADGVGWRTDGTGKYLSATPPTDWALDRNVLWSYQTPAWSNATPVIVGNKIFICAEPDKLLCVDASNGQLLWERANGYDTLTDFADPTAMAEANKKAADLRKQIAQAQGGIWKINQGLKKTPDDADLKAQLQTAQDNLKALQTDLNALSQANYVMPATHDVNGYATPTPVSDGQRVYVLFGQGVAACYDLDGNRIWNRFVERPTNVWGHSTSPVLAGGKLIVHILNLTALDLATGQTAWQVRLPEDWGTPQVGSIGGVPIVCTAAGDIVQATDGKVLAKNLCRLDFGDPLLANGVIYCIQNGGKAFKLPDTVAEPFQPQQLWQTQVKKDRYYAGCILHDGIIYGVTQVGFLSAIDASNGQVIYEQNLQIKPTMYPAITMAGNLLYVSNDQGTTVLVKPGRTFEEAGRLTLEPFRACPVFVNSRVYIRTMKGLYCIGQ